MRLTKDQLVAGLDVSIKTADWWDDHLNEAMALYGIDLHRQRVAAFIAQVAHESGRFHYVREIWGPTRAQSRYEGRRDLGNTEKGDGHRFLGRGLIQLTGRANARRMTTELRKKIASAPDFEVQPELLELPRWAALSAGCFWDWMDLNALADEGAITAISKKVNGGFNGLAERKKYWKQLLEVLP